MTDRTPQQQMAALGGIKRLMDLSTAYWGSQALFTANRLGIFTLLANGPMTADRIAAALNTTPRSTALLLDACEGIGLLDSTDGNYANSALASALLVPGGPTYMGEAIMYGEAMYKGWGDLVESVKSGKPSVQPDSYLSENLESTREFVRAMHNRALGIGRMLVSLCDLSGRKKLLDIGGGPGTYSALFVNRYPGLNSTVLDLPGVVAVAAEIIEEMGAGGSVDLLAGDYHQTPFPTGNDAVLISGVTHRENEASCRDLIQRSADALSPGGLLAISDVFLEEKGSDRTAFAALFGLNMMLSAPDGGVHSTQQMAQWMEQAGLSVLSSVPFPPPMPHHVIIAQKSA
jgi:predicted O-methyltransferase YrrM